MRIRLFIFFFTFFVSMVYINDTYAQCAMCKATVEKGEAVQAPIEQRVRGLNNGILYMMVIPYILAGVIAYFWYRNSKKERERKNEIQRIIRSKMSQVQGGQNI